MTQSNTDYCPSSIRIIKRVPRSDAYPHGAQTISRIPLTRPSLLLLGGGATVRSRDANYYASLIQEILYTNNVRDFDLYSAHYNFGDRIPGLDRANVFRQMGYTIKLSYYPPDNDRLELKLARMCANEPIPHTAIRTFNIFIRPRLITRDNRLRDMDTILKYMRRLRIWTHSHGGAVIHYMGNYMRQEMSAMGFTKYEIDLVCKNLLVIGHAPTAPMFYNTFYHINFASCSDTVMENVNHMSDYLSTNAANVTPMYFGNRLGNLVTTGQFRPDYTREHDARYLAQNSAEYQTLTDEGKLVFDTECNAIITAVKSAIDGSKLPSVREMLDGPSVDFDTLRKNGTRFYQIMLNDIRINRKRGK